ncbi:MAG: tetratricopeptide repeat protein [Candidatus Polarisedimenticolia bacterium]
MLEDPVARCNELTHSGSLQLRKGEFKEAVETFRETLRLAESIEDRVLVSRAHCNISTALLALGQVQEAEKGLRAILLNSRDSQSIFIASSNLASALRRQGKPQKALFYARRALRACEPLDNALWKATCHNLLGNIYLSMSYLDDATSEYRTALSISQKGGLGTSYPVDYIKECLGYCTLLKRRYRQGIALILEAQSIADANGNVRCLVECYQDLSFAYMQLKELPRAEEYGLKALKVAEERGYLDILKNCYYLLGEIYLLMGDEAKSDLYLDRLQALYPHLAVLKDFLKTFDVSNIINLKNPF